MSTLVRRAACFSLMLVLVYVMPTLGQSADAPAGLTVGLTGPMTTLGLGDQIPFHETANVVLDTRVIDVAGTATRLVLWQEQLPDGTVAPYYAVSLDGRSTATVRRTSYVLNLRDYAFDPAVQSPAVSSLAADASTHLYLVQFVTQPLEEFRNAIRTRGGIVRHFLTNHTHIVEMSADTRDAVAALPYVRWVGPYHPAYRLEAFLRDNLASTANPLPTQRYNIQVFEAGLGQKQAVAERIASIGGAVDKLDAGKFLLIATLTPAQLGELARWNEVLFVDRWSPLENDMDIVRDLGGANYLETVAGFTGQGVRGEAFDGGFNINHPDFASRPLLVHGGPVGLSDHGTATTGVCFGDGAGDPRARGLMPDGQGIVADHNNMGMSGPSRYAHTAELLEAPYFAVFQTSSVGDGRTTEYTTISADIDAMLFDLDIVHCQSQSNAGSRDSRPQAWAKNIISGGAVEHYDTPTRDDDCWCHSGSIGPASDGRIKPDLCFFYDETYTTYSFGDGYGEFGGTSGATPSIAGHVGLFHQMWSEGIFGNEVDPAGTVFENRPHSTTAKAVMINTANPYPFSGTGHDLTRVHQGWGNPDLTYLYDMRDRISIIDETELLVNMESVEYVAFVDDGESALRITLVYADPAGAPSASQHRINDLTLKVTAPSGEVYWGNHGLLEGNWSTPGGEANTVDTVENVFIENPDGGVWSVTIMAAEINQDSHVETPELDADFALVVSGGFLATCTSDGRIALDKSKYACESQATLRVVDCDLNTDDTVIETVTVTITSDSEPAGETVLLTETAAETSDFRATIDLSTSDAAGVLLVQDGDTLTAVYIDADNGQGGTDIEVTDTGIVDCTPPVISAVDTIHIEPRDATIVFATDESAKGTVHYGLACDALTETVTRTGVTMQHELRVLGLQDDTVYFYSIEAVDEAGNVGTDDAGGACYTFTTPQIPDFFTEKFDSDNDLDNLSLTFVPNGTIDYYAACVEPIFALPTDPGGGTTLTLSDDTYATVTLEPGVTLPFYGTNHNRFYPGSNGYITFLDGDSSLSESFENHFDLPRIAALFDDLNPSQAGTVSWKQLADRVAVTWLGVTEHSGSNSNTFQIEMFFDGTIRISFLDLDANDGLAGLSEGEGLSPDFFETDLSGVGSCGPRPPAALGAQVGTPVGTPLAIILPAVDDGLPDPPAALAYIVTSLPTYSLRDAGDDHLIVAAELPYTLIDGGDEVMYTPAAGVSGTDSFQYKVNDGGVPPEGGDSHLATIDITLGGPQLFVEFSMDENPGWLTEAAWAFGQPTGGSGSSGGPDPLSGHTGGHVYGYNLAGGYTDDMPAYYLTTTAIDCTGAIDVELRFWRWLGIESATYDHANVQVSNNGTNWTTVWEHTGSSVSDSAWSQVAFDISAIADEQPAVYIRWGMGTTDGSVTYGGWNIDDVELWAVVESGGCQTTAACPNADVNCDNLVDGFDIAMIRSTSNWLKSAGQLAEPRADVNADGVVDGFDIAVVRNTVCWLK